MFVREQYSRRGIEPCRVGADATAMKADRPLRILLLEDNPLDEMLVVEHLLQASLDHHVETVQMVGEAVAALMTGPVDIVLADLHVPDCAGIEVITQLVSAAPDVPVVVLSGAEDEELAVAAVQEGAQDYLLKRRLDADLLTRSIRYARERKRAEAALARMALRDALTGLPNRSLFTDRLRQAHARTARSGHPVAVLFLDLDGFKLVNDSLGHDAGDDLLRQIADRLEETVRPGDTVARFGGDEFAVLCEDMAPGANGVAAARRIIEAIGLSFRLGDQEVRLGVSVGIAVADAAVEDVAVLLRQSDAAMYAAKRAGGGYRLYSEEMRAQATERLQLATELHTAVETGQLVLHYQPQFRLGNRRPIGLEALVRWQHPERGLVFPDQFIPVAEESGLIVKLGRWVLEEACGQLAQWQRADSAAALPISVNVSARQLAHPDFVAHVAEALMRSGADPERLCLEITETTVIDDADVAAARLQALKDLGVRIAIDDFGTGYASLNYLHRFPVDTLKIDRSFVASMGDTRQDQIVAAVVRLTASMGLEAVAEGVEREDQAEALVRMGCSIGQGFLFARPGPADAIELLLEELAGPARPARVVVCDDQPLMRQFVRRMLEEDDAAEVVGEAADGDAVVGLVARTRPDIVLLDLTMPGAGGLAALGPLREVAPDAQVVVISASDEDGLCDRVLALGASQYVSKQAGPAQIRAALRESLGRFAAV